ncbi:hypothetical protein MalM25_13230 [Planctomycetes bacterium MalM25]|nr:hypothetical protein MalM25_13230 [Planctomycetes bacterium MalM25]
MTPPDALDRLRHALSVTPEGIVIRVRAKPGSRRNGVTGVREDELMIAVTSPADKGRANEAIVKLLAKTLGIARSRVNLVAGPTNHHKRFCVLGAGFEGVLLALSEALPNEN